MIIDLGLQDGDYIKLFKYALCYWCELHSCGQVEGLVSSLMLLEEGVCYVAYTFDTRAFWFWDDDRLVRKQT